MQHPFKKTAFFECNSAENYILMTIKQLACTVKSTETRVQNRAEKCRKSAGKPAYSAHSLFAPIPLWDNMIQTHPHLRSWDIGVVLHCCTQFFLFFT